MVGTVVGYLGLLWRAFFISWIWGAASIVFPPTLLAFWFQHPMQAKTWGLICVIGIVGFFTCQLGLSSITQRKRVAVRSAARNAVIISVPIKIRILSIDSTSPKPPETVNASYLIEVTPSEAGFARLFGFNSGGNFSPVSDLIELTAGKTILVTSENKPWVFTYDARGKERIPGGDLFLLTAKDRDALVTLSADPPRETIIGRGHRIRTSPEEK